MLFDDKHYWFIIDNNCNHDDTFIYDSMNVKDPSRENDSEASVDVSKNERNLICQSLLNTFEASNISINAEITVAVLTSNYIYFKIF